MSLSKEKFDLNPRKAKETRAKKAKEQKKKQSLLVKKMGKAHPSENYPYTAAIKADEMLMELGYHHSSDWSWSKKSDKGITTVTLHSSFESEHPVLSIKKNKKERDFNITSTMSGIKKYL